MAGDRQRQAAIFALIALAGLWPAGERAIAQTVIEETITGAEVAAVPLYLGVSINGHDTKLIANFQQHMDGRFSAPASELRELGIIVPEKASGDVFLDDLAGLSFIYDEQKQMMAITADSAALVPNMISGMGTPELLAPQPGFGSVLNYGFYATTLDRLADGDVDISGASLSLDHRAYTPWGVLSNTGILRTQGLTYEGASGVRTDSYFTYADQESMTTYTVGDVLSSSLPWTRSIRLGGGQVRRDFSLREDILPTPLLTAQGTAAVPSTVDVYIGNVRTFTGDVAPGPFVLTDVPLIDQHGDARVVLRDASGRETEVSVPFYASQFLLKEGMLDYSVEAGFARQDYGEESFSYDTSPLASASLRYGLTDQLTLEAHAEGKPDLAMAGAGLTTVLFNRAEATVAAGGSLYDGDAGFFAYGHLSTDFAGFNLSASSFRSFGNFADLAYATGLEELGKDKLLEDYSYLSPPRAMDIVSLGMPQLFDRSSVNLSLIHALREDEEDLIASASYSRDLGWHNASLRFNGFVDLGDGGFGLIGGFSMPLGETYLNAGVARGSDGRITPAASVQKPLGSEVGSLGYRAEASGTDITGASGASASYRSSFGVAEARIRADDARVSVSASFDGALVMAGGSVFASNTIYDGFAVVDAGVPDLPVLLQNNPVARTGRNGKALVPGLRSYAANKISIDVAALPVDASLSATDETVIPARRSGVTVNFSAGVNSSALVILRDADGKYVSPGAVATLNGGAPENIVGYDGQLWLEGLSSRNTLKLQTADGGSCSASFSYAPDPGNQVTIDPVVCK